jgi:hypothetical protein
MDDKDSGAGLLVFGGAALAILMIIMAIFVG